ncbi:MAG: signal peptide peptidase SppA [Rikenellaceae bacterium]|nr:signal peptide peptidase SppA [Rikenellaceae bacterium]
MNFLKTFLAGVLAFVAGSFLLFFLWIIILLGIAGSMEEPVSVASSSILKIDLSETITDAPSTDPLGGLDIYSMQKQKQLSLLQVIRTLEAAQSDDRIKGLYLRMNKGGTIAGTALIEELRKAIVNFKQSGKFVVAYNEVYSQGSYYLASAADKIYLQPEGALSWTGLSANVMFYKGLLDKLDLRAEIFRPTACKYKSAVEPYFLDKMSSANRDQQQQLVNSVWKTIVNAISESRNITPEKLNRLADKLDVALPEEALKYGLVDSLIYEDQMKGIFADLGVETNEEGDYDYISLGSYATQVGADLKNITADQVAIVYADGAIVDGEGVGKEIYGNTLAAKLAKVRGEKKIKAVVLRVNSPGGSALASDVIWREMELLKAEKPIVVSMGSYAASGGYYISCPADVIVADKTTLTGSIGVFGMMLDSRAALKNKLGITIDQVTTNANADFFGPLTPAQRAMIMRGVDKVYTTFTSLVSKGRNLPIEKVLDIAEGRVWTGEEALGIGLVDMCGGLKEAIAVAADKAELGDNFRVVEQLDTPSGLAAILSSLNVRIGEMFTRSQLGLMMQDYNRVREALGRQGVVMYSPCKVDLQ